MRLSGRCPERASCSGISDAAAVTAPMMAIYVLHIVRNAYHVAAVAERRHEQGAKERAERAALPAVERAAPDHHRGDDVELHPVGGGRIADGQVGELHQPGQAREHPAQRVYPRPLRNHANAAEPGGLLVGAERENMPPEHGVPQQNEQSRGQHQEQPHARRQPEPGRCGVHIHQAVEPGLGRHDGLFAAKPLGKTPRYLHRAQSDNERNYAQPGDQQAVECPAQTASGKGRGNGQRRSDPLREPGG